jgi:hypothetical protein
MRPAAMAALLGVILIGSQAQVAAQNAFQRT